MEGWSELALACLLSVNVLTFVVWGFDKRRARRGGRRVPEAQLLLLTLLGGVGGAWLGCSAFRHKTRKTSFRIQLVLVTLLALGWMIFAAVRGWSVIGD